MSFLTKQRNIPIGHKTGVALALVLIVLIFGSWGYNFYSTFTSPHSASEPQQREPNAIELYAQAQEFVKQTLKAPSTAKFPFDPVHVGTDGTGLYQVESYVDAENSFGAQIRSHWMLNMRLVGSSWVLDKMQIDGKIVYDASSSN